MKKMGKRIIFAAGLLCASLAFTGCANEFEIEEMETATSASATSRSVLTSGYVTYTSSPEIYDLVGQGYNEGEKGPVSVTKGIFRKGFTSKSVYLVCLSGTEIIKGQSTGYLTDLLSGFNLDNDYSKNVVNIILNNIPANSNIILAGHSLGGMVAQQVAANDTVKKNYNIMNTVTFGSPLLDAGNREGTVKRLGDTNDAVPYLSVNTFTKTLWQVAGLNREDGGYKFASEDAHVKSYANKDEWKGYDITGTKNGGAQLVLDFNTQKFYQSKTSWER